MTDDHVIFCIGLKLSVHARAILRFGSAIFQLQTRICIKLDAIKNIFHAGIFGTHLPTVEPVPVIIHRHEISLHRSRVKAAFVKQHHRIHRGFLLTKEIDATRLNDIFNRNKIERVRSIVEKIEPVVVDHRVFQLHLTDHGIIIRSHECDQLVLRVSGRDSAEQKKQGHA